MRLSFNSLFFHLLKGDFEDEGTTANLQIAFLNRELICLPLLAILSVPTGLLKSDPQSMLIRQPPCAVCKVSASTDGFICCSGAKLRETATV